VESPEEPAREAGVSEPQSPDERGHVEHLAPGEASQLGVVARVREALHLSVEDEVEFTVHPDGEVTLRGMTVIPADQRWFWTEEWQAGEREASAEIAAGDLKVYDDMADLFADLDL